MGFFSFLRRRPDFPAAPPGPGALAEDMAARFLLRQGLQVLARNHRCRGGEVDLVCRDGRTVVFVEVRLRTHPDHGGPAESITAGKRHRIVRAARHWLAGKPECPCRFDAVLLDHLSPDAIEWVRDAFPE